MKPASEASGVRSSWLALATKSTRICAELLLLGEVVEGDERAPAAAAAARREACETVGESRSIGTRSTNWTTCDPPGGDAGRRRR